MMNVTTMITLEEARKIISASEKKAIEIGQPQNIAIVDAGGNLGLIRVFFLFQRVCFLQEGYLYICTPFLMF